MALAADISRNISVHRSQDHPVNATSVVFAGSILGEDASTGAARALVAGDNSMGIARSNGATGGAADGATSVQAATVGILSGVTITGATGIADYGATVYASDDTTLTLVSTSNTLMGKIVAFDADRGTFSVYFQAAAMRSL